MKRSVSGEDQCLEVHAPVQLVHRAYSADGGDEREEKGKDGEECNDQPHPPRQLQLERKAGRDVGHAPDDAEDDGVCAEPVHGARGGQATLR